jgi:membrane associated rhomboid family serine protease
VLFAVFLSVVGFVAYRATASEDRARLLRALIAAFERLAEWRAEDIDLFRAALRARARWPVVAPLVVFLNVVVYLAVATGPAAARGASSLVAWGGSTGPLTTNGEWWRLATATFLHESFWALLINMAVVVQVGFIVDRLAGPTAFATVYLGAGVLAGLASIAMRATAVNAGATASIYGVLGLFLSALVRGWFHRSPLTVPVAALVRLAPAAAAFFLSTAASDGADVSADMAGLAVGLLFGLATASRLDEPPPGPKRLRAVIAGGLAVVLACAIPLRGITDVAPVLEQLAAAEHRTTEAYAAAVGRFRGGKLSIDALSQFIERTIVPELAASAARIDGLTGVPWADQPRVAEARRYLTLRTESWRVRANSLRDTAGGGARFRGEHGDEPEVRERAEERHRLSAKAFGKAETLERESLAALDHLHP